MDRELTKDAIKSAQDAIIILREIQQMSYSAEYKYNIDLAKTLLNNAIDFIDRLQGIIK